MSRALPLLLVLAGCWGGPDVHGPIVSTCPADCLGPMSAEVAVDCAVWGANVGLAQAIADDAGIIPAAEFCDPGIQVHVANVEQFDSGALAHAQGGFINLSKRGIHLLHERLHLWDESNSVYNPDHVGWDVNGYRAADFLFRNASVKYVPFVWDLDGGA